MKRGRRQTPLSSQVPKERNRIAHLRVRRTVARDEMTSAWITIPGHLTNHPGCVDRPG